MNPGSREDDIEFIVVRGDAVGMISGLGAGGGGMDGGGVGGGGFAGGIAVCRDRGVVLGSEGLRVT